MAKQPIVTSDMEDAIIKQALIDRCASIRRQLAKHITGSAIHKATLESLQETQSLLTRFGG